LCVFFFFQAEDGIRDATVTGVQTCALPIFEHRRLRALLRPRVVLVAEERQRLLADLVEAGAQRLEDLGRDRLALFHEAQEQVLRSEERRVGKECGGRRAVKLREDENAMSAR